MQIKYNHSDRVQAIKYIVIHDTGNTAKGANAQANFNYFDTADRGSSADFFVDDKQTLQANNYYKYYTWHCGDGKGKYGITNANSIGIEICINSDSNYADAVKNTVKLVKALMAELHIPISNVVRHYDASRKNCPRTMSINNWGLWLNFLKELQDMPDKANIPWYNDAQYFVTSNKISDGTRPNEPVTRAEVWQMIYKMAQLKK